MTQQIASEPVYTTWTDAIDNAQGRTTDLGTNYLATSAAALEGGAGGTERRR